MQIVAYATKEFMRDYADPRTHDQVEAALDVELRDAVKQNDVPRIRVIRLLRWNPTHRAN